MKTSFWTKLLDLLSPRLCVACGRRLSPEESVLCPRCMLDLPLTDHLAHPYDNYMARLLWGHFPVEKAVAMFFYEPKSRPSEIIYSMKYHGQQKVAHDMGHIFARQLQAVGFFADIDCLVPIPLTRKRRWQRGYNQAQEIARGIGEETGLPIYNKVVERCDFTTSQTHLNIFQRRENVEHAFRLVHSGQRLRALQQRLDSGQRLQALQQTAGAESIAHKHVLLVDDVVTTGSTVIACARQLQQIEDVRISVLSLGFTKP